MSMVEELKRRMASIADAEAAQTDYDYSLASDEAYYFLRDHGQALVECVRDAERYRWLRYQNHRDVSSIFDMEYGCDFDQAIDLARTKAGAGGGA